VNSVFQPLNAGGIRLNNRIIRSATFEGMAEDSGRPKKELKELYAKLAKGGAGAIITSFTGVEQRGKAVPFMNMIDRDDLVDDYREITSRVHQHETPVIMQITHAGRQTTASVAGGQPVSSSALRDKLFFRDKPRALAEEQISLIIEQFINAIERAQKAGFDGVQVQASHGFLLSQFLTPYMNKRKDNWGGSTENRFRIVREIICGAKERLGDYPILAKISGHDGQKNGMTADEAARISVLLQESGCDGIEVSCGVGEDMFNSIRVEKPPVNGMLELVPNLQSLPKPVKSIFRFIGPWLVKAHQPITNYNVSAAEQIKRYVDIPVIVVGGIRALSDIEQIIESKKADGVALSRPFIIEPDIVNRFKTGKQTISKCKSCGFCAVAIIDKPLKCYYGNIPE
jgi:2,4-dienoyl-CoA reductase-like NADH-dependent reductase (Old Yellow Enzyme family)